MKNPSWWAYKDRSTAAGGREPGPHGVTLAMIAFSRKHGRRYFRAGRPEPRDRSLNGKARVRARKAAQRRPLNAPSDW